MEYDYIKSRPLNRRESSRLALTTELERRLEAMSGEERIRYRARDHARNPLERGDRTPAHLLEAMLCFFSHPTGDVAKPLIDWVLCYAYPTVLNVLIDALADEQPERGILHVVKHADPALLLPREHLTPDVQKVRRPSDRPAKALICFTGNALKLNVPVQLFHMVAIRTFDLIVYLRDETKQRFIHGVPGLGTNLEGLAGALRKIVPEDSHTAILSTSSGGLAASRVAEAMNADRLVLFSPIFTYRDVSAVTDGAGISPGNARLYFAKDSSMDAALVESWKESHLRDSIRWLDSSSHGTLTHMVETDSFDRLADWLAGAPEQLPET